LGNDASISAWNKIERYIELYAERVVNNNCFQKMLYQEMAMQRRGDLADKISDILMKNVSEVHKILRDGIDSGEFNKDTDMELVIATIYGTKNFIINAPQLASQMLGYDVLNDKMLEEKLRPRIEIYMKRLLKSYLLNEHDHTNK
jgi:TetR/AcrR family transcriptional regulator